MEFISLPLCANPHILVKDLGGPEYDDHEFATFGHRCGWNTESIIAEGLVYVEQNDSNPARLCEVGQLMQTWLFFGIISVFIGRPVQRSEYSVDGGQGMLILNTSSLLENLTPAIRAIQKSKARTDGLSYDRYRAIMKALRCATDFLSRFNAMQARDLEKFWPWQVQLQLSVLLQALIAGISPTGQNVVMPTVMKLVHYNVILRTQGWCPYDIERLAGLEDAGLYCLSQMPQPVSKPGSSHEICSKNQCLAVNVDWDTYRTSHVNEQCVCRFIGCDWLQVAVMLGEGHIPVVTVEEDRNTTSILFHCSRNTRYVAFSHVWADGLGNLTSDSLPACQLQRLQALADTLRKPTRGRRHTPFWIDTLMVPVLSPRHRALAIQLLRRTYRMARAVLVLDRQLYDVRKPQHIDELAFRIVGSGWLTRLWTYQEGAVASKLYFQFSDGSLDCEDILDNLGSLCETTHKHNPLRPALSDIWDTLDSIRNLRDRLEDAKDDCPLSTIWMGFAGRTTSRVTDVPICIANLLKMDVSNVVDADESQMQRFWLMMPRLSASIIWNGGRKLSIPGLRWAPASLADPYTLFEGIRFNSVLAKPTPVGLEFQGLPGYALHNTWIPLDHKNAIPFSFVDHNKKFELQLMRHIHIDAPTWQQMSLHRFSDTMVFLEHIPDLGRTVYGFLVVRDTDSQKMNAVRWLGSVMIHNNPQDHVFSLYPTFHSERRYWQDGQDLVLKSDEYIDLEDAWGEALDEKLEWIIT